MTIGPGPVLQTLREWGWRHGVAVVAVGTFAAFNLGDFAFLPPEVWFPVWVYNVVQFGLPYVFLLRVADHAVVAGAPRRAAYLAVVLLGAPVGVWLMTPALVPFFDFEIDRTWTLRDDLGVLVTRWITFGMATLAYAHWRGEHDARARLRALEVERARRESTLQSARLLALQARIEPQFLFDALDRVRETMDRSVDEAERRLADLIALLRAMQPAAGSTASSVAREVDLVHAFGRAAGLPALQPGQLSLAADDESRHARLAPLVLLPALRSLAADAAAAQWRIAARRVADRLRLEIAPGHADAAALAALQRIELGTLGGRLAAVHGAAATLHRAADAAPALQIEIPFEAATPAGDEHAGLDR